MNLGRNLRELRSGEPGAIPGHPSPNSTMEKTRMKPRMMKRNSEFQNSLTKICCVLLMLCAGQPGFGQQGTGRQTEGAALAAPVNAVPTQSSAAQERQENEAPASASQGSGGIKIHGHWKFVVHNPDGTLASTRVFENSLLTPNSGDYVLGTALIGQTVVVDWAVVLCPTAGTSWVAGVGSPATYCPGGNSIPIAVLVPSPNGLIETFLSGTTNCGGGCVAGLTAAPVFPNGPTNPVTLVLSGSYVNTTSQVVTINAVGTIAGVCSTSGSGFLNFSPATCDTTNFQNPTPANGNGIAGIYQFTGTNQTQILTAGQSLSITVTFSFS